MDRPTNVYVQARIDIVGLHQWLDAPDDTRYLRSLHRHVFVIRPLARVQHTDRDVEFHTLADQIVRFLHQRFPRHALASAVNFGTWSCEQIASLLVANFDLEACSVHEDDENGAIVHVDHAAETTRDIAQALAAFPRQ